jgi:hypothetical protein
VYVDGVVDLGGQRVFAPHLIQARDPEVGWSFFAQHDPDAGWLSDLRQVFADRFPPRVPFGRASLTRLSA